MEGGTGPPSLGQSSGHSQIRAVPIASSLHGCSHRASLQDRGRVARSRVSSRPHRGGRLSPTGDPESSEPAGTGTGPTLPSTFWSCPTQILGPLTARTTAGRGRGASAWHPEASMVPCPSLVVSMSHTWCVPHLCSQGRVGDLR